MSGRAISRFQPGVTPPSDSSENDIWFVFYNSKILIKEHDGKIIIPHGYNIRSFNDKVIRKNLSVYWTDRTVMWQKSQRR
ncbi:hypothetical protein OXPF_09750 [Oxobacter pfennigii]|uniref:Uncharacterized protein n=1 Tax=Oxobacter pfennigii TaxID=36849 RepID=A0A0P8WD89_9CLOT|nr:hypothetical protein [Oxobacter pfennigii]KPU45741.1 hypothetical protein OXPF_09750 [Oxobacter pfennigii]